MSIGLVYIGLLALGVVYAFLTGVFGWISDAFSGADVHVDLPGGVDVGAHLDGGAHMNPIGGTLVATFITGFGGGGVVAHYLLQWTLLPGLGVALGSGVVLALAAFLLLDALFKQTQAGSEYQPTEIQGREAEVITTIPAGGTGEVAYEVRGRREISPARSVGEEVVAKGSRVLIEKTLGGTLYVQRRG